MPHKSVNINRILDDSDTVIAEVEVSRLEFDVGGSPPVPPPPPPPPPPTGNDPGFAPQEYREALFKPLEAFRPALVGAETARCAYFWAEPGQLNRYPIAVRHGVPPYRFELIQGPSGMTLSLGHVRMPDGSIQREQDANILKWIAPDIDGITEQVHVRVTDQEQASVDFIWSIQTDRAKYIHKAPEMGTESGDGTRGSPFTEWSSIVGTDNTPIHEDKFIKFHGAEHIMEGFASNDGNVNLNGGSKANAWLAEDTTIINLNNSTLRLAGVNDFLMDGITLFHNDRTDDVGRMIQQNNGGQRNTFSRCTFDDYFVGTAPGQKNAAVHYTSNAPAGWDVCFIDCTLVGNMGTWLQWFAMNKAGVYHTKAVALDFNTGEAASQGMIYLKSDNVDVDIYDLDLIDMTTTSANRNGVVALAGAGAHRDISARQ